VRKNNTDTNYDVNKNYTTTGQNEDGGMTQKAITTALAAQKTELETRINNIPASSGGGNVSGNFTSADKGSLVVVDDNGNLAASTTDETTLIKTEIILGTYEALNAVGVEIDYDNKTVERIQSARNLNAGTDFDAYSMFGGRRRCVVNDSGEIVAFYGENDYEEDGSVGQVMVYQPKFYYLKMPLKVTKTGNRTLINKEVLLISETKQAGFKLHPLFIDTNGNPLDYVLLSAYEGCAYSMNDAAYNRTDAQNVNFTTDKLSSISGAKPISGTSQAFNVSNAEQLASNRGIGWKLTNLAAESVNQMLMVIEFGSLNLQSAFYRGIVDTTAYSNVNSSSLTGSTSNLGSTSGQAEASIQTHGGISTSLTGNGNCAISYRGFENPYGNMWRFIGEAKASGSSFIVNNHTFASELPTASNWISRFGYDDNMPWAFIPSECSGANSALPVGDYTYISTDTGDKCCVIGGKNSSTDYTGPFYYAMDYAYDTNGYSYSGRIMYIPNTTDAAYTINITKWENEVGGE